MKQQGDANAMMDGMVMIAAGVSAPLNQLCRDNINLFELHAEKCPLSPDHLKQCAGHGTCDSATGLCKCEGVYFGPDCALRN